MIRRIIHIDKEKCNGCGICANACHEGAIAIVDGKAELIRDDYCDGLGDCLPNCPTGAITFVEREAAAYDEAAVKANMQKKSGKEKLSLHGAVSGMPAFSGCPGTRAQQLSGSGNEAATPVAATTVPAHSQLAQWPVQIMLAPVNAPYFTNAKLLIAADCTAYAYANFHQDFMKNHVTLIGCPKLDDIDYSEKLTAIIRDNDIRDLTVIRMEVPCCGGMELAVKKALQASGKFLPWQVVTLSLDGNILE